MCPKDHVPYQRFSLADDAHFMEWREQQIREICHAFGAPVKEVTDFAAAYRELMRPLREEEERFFRTVRDFFESQSPKTPELGVGDV